MATANPDPASIMDDAVAAWRKAATPVLQQLFFSVGCIEFCPRAHDYSRGTRYRLHDVTLATALRPRNAGADSAPPTPAWGPRCGDNGGHTKVGAPCKRKASAHGRCRLHPAPTEAGVLPAGTALPRVTLDAGHLASQRPQPATVAWGAITVYVKGKAYVAPALAGNVTLASGEVIFTALVSEALEAVRPHVKGLPYDVTLTMNGLPCGVDLCWSVDFMQQRFGLANPPIDTETRTPWRHGYRVGDYSPTSQTRLVTHAH